MKAVFPKSLLDVALELDDEEGALLLGGNTGKALVVEAIAFTQCRRSLRRFECLPAPREDLIGVVHKHRERVSLEDLIISKLWPLYVVLTGKGVEAYSYGKRIEVVVV